MQSNIPYPQSSTSSSDLNNVTVLCLLCHKKFTARDVTIHVAKSHKLPYSSFTTNPNTSNISDNINNSNTSSIHLIDGSLIGTPSDSSPAVSQAQCPHCGGSFNGSKGVNIHISRSHPHIHRSTLVTNLTKNASQPLLDEQADRVVLVIQNPVNLTQVLT